MSSKELEGRGTIMFSVRKPFCYLLKAKTQRLFLVMGLHLLVHRAGLIWQPENPKGTSIKLLCLCVCVHVCTHVYTRVQMYVMGVGGCVMMARI